MDGIKKILIVSSDKGLKEVLSFCFDGWGYEVFLRDYSNKYTLEQDIEDIKRVSPDVIVVDVQSASNEQLNICRLLSDNFSTAFIPIIALINKRQLREHLLNLKQGVDDYMIKPPDPLDLRIRIEMTIRRSKHSIQASALTGLPGGKILEDMLREKLAKNIPFSFGYLDIDNFKSFNDVYGYQKGDRVILHTAYILFTVLRRFGGSEDFVSHIGGDDFAFISTLDKYEQVCRNFIKMFDNIIPFHYSLENRKQGFMIARDRTRKMKKMPLMSVSIAVVSHNKSSSLKNTIEINEKIAEIKRYLKTIPKSKFMVDRRGVRPEGDNVPDINKNYGEDRLYMPLGQILLEENVISYEQLDEALNIHWKRGILLGEVLKELGFVGESELQKALVTQRNNFTYPAFNK